MATGPRSDPDYGGRVVIDAHLHLWDPARHRYEWLLRRGNETLNRPFTFEDFRARAAQTGVDKAVLVQADDHAADTDAMFDVAWAHDEIAGVVAWVPLDQPGEAAQALDRLQAEPKFAGIRNLIHDQPDPDWLLRPEVGEGLALLEQRGIPLDVIAVLPRHLEHVPVLSERYPRLRMVLDHLAHPPLGERGDGDPDWEPWRALITAAAANPLVSAKISGLYPPATRDIRPFVEFAIDLFGPGRLMFGSDWPVAELAGGYQRAAGTLLELIAMLPPAHRAAILSGTARAVYRLRDVDD
jgi:L-fuconolactonase